MIIMKIINHLVDPEIVEEILDCGFEDYIYNNAPLKEIQTGDKNTDKRIRMLVRICRQAMLKHKLEKYVEDYTGETDEDVVRYFNNILSDDEKHRFFIFAADKHGNLVNLFHYGRKKHIHYLSRLANCDEITLYYHATPFRYWTADRNAISFRSIIVDIDTVLFDFDPHTADKETVRNFFIKKYCLPPALYPDAITLSGHGAHITYYIEECTKENFEIRQRIYDNMIFLLSGDVAVRNGARKYRCPTSFNLKDSTPIRTRLFLYDNGNDHSLERFLPYLKPQEEIDEYFSKSKDASNEKRRKTNIQKLLYAGFTMEQIENKEYLKRKPKKPKNTKPAVNKSCDKKPSSETLNEPDKDVLVADFYYDKDYDLDFSKLRYRNDYRTQGFSYWNVLVDIHNFLVHHSANKHLLLHKRNLFFHILSNIGRHIFEEPEDFIEYCTQYCDETSNYYDEMCITIYANFSGNFYPYKLETIADAIGFTKEDIMNSFCSFSREEREARRRKYERDYYRTNRSDNKAARKKQACMKYIRENPEADYKEVTDRFQISTATFYRYKNELTDM